MCALQSNKNFGIEVNFLTGRYVATAHNDRKQAEWPPHTSRLFSAMVSAWAEDGQDATERKALEWLECQEPPNISAPDATCRKTVLHYVPVNDTTIMTSSQNESAAIASAQKVGGTNPKKALALFPEKRTKQERFYPSVTPHGASVTYVWRQTPQDDMAKALDNLLSRVTRLGHPSSLVSCRVSTDPPVANYILSKFGESIRAVRRGQVDTLVNQYSRHLGFRRRSLPYESARYRKKNDENAQQSPYLTPNTSGDWVVLKLAPGSRFLPPTQAARVAAKLRAVILSHIKGPIPEEISGIGPDGAPTTDPHAAFIPLPYAGFPHADGRILGIAVSMPRSLTGESRRAVYRAIGNWEDSHRTGEAVDEDRTVKPGLKLGDLCVSRQIGPEPLVSLRRGTWSRKSCRWVSVTPISLPRHPGSLGKGSASARAAAWSKAESAVMSSCEHVGLPRPLKVVMSHDPFTPGSYPAARYPPFTQKARDGSPIRRKLIHASLTFEEEVAGPMMIGTGRFAGLGLMYPMPDGGLES